MRPQLAEPLRLHDIRDLEAHIRAAIRTIPGVTTSLPAAEHEDLICDLIGTIWEASLRYDPTRGPAFSNLAHRLARHRTIDHIRHRNGYTRNGTQGQRTTTSLDTQPNPHDPRSTPLGSHLTDRTHDPRESRSPDLIRLLDRRRRQGDGLFAQEHQPAHGQAA